MARPWIALFCAFLLGFAPPARGKDLEELYFAPDNMRVMESQFPLMYEDIRGNKAGYHQALQLAHYPSGEEILADPPPPAPSRIDRERSANRRRLAIAGSLLLSTYFHFKSRDAEEGYKSARGTFEATNEFRRMQRDEEKRNMGLGFTLLLTQMKF